MNKPSVRFQICKEDECAVWPAHGNIILTSHDGTKKSPPSFSRAASRLHLKAVVDDGLVDGDAAGAVDCEIRASSLSDAVTIDDRLVRSKGYPTCKSVIDLRYGVTPPFPGSGPTRVEMCTDGACDFAYCSKMPPHALLFLANFGKPALTTFSHETATKYAGTAVEYGVFTPQDEEAVIEGLNGLKLEKKVTRTDRMIASGSPHLEAILEYHFGIVPLPDGVTPVSFEICGGALEARMDDFRHAHLNVYGFDTTSGVYSKTIANKLVDGLINDGFIDPAEGTRLANEIDAAKLPPESPMDDTQANPFVQLLEQLAGFLG